MISVLVAVLGLCWFSFKKRKIHPFIITTTFACDVASGRIVTLAGTVIGAVLL